MKLFIKIVYFYPKLELSLYGGIMAIKCNNNKIFNYQFSFFLKDHTIYSATRIYDRKISTVKILLDELKNLI